MFSAGCGGVSATLGCHSMYRSCRQIEACEHQLELKMEEHTAYVRSQVSIAFSILIDVLALMNHVSGETFVLCCDEILYCLREEPPHYLIGHNLSA